MWYRRNADRDIRELERRWAQDHDESAGRQLQEWKRRTEPITTEEAASWIDAERNYYVYNADLYCEDCAKAMMPDLIAEMRREVDEQGYEHQLPEVHCNNTLCRYRAPITQAQRDEDGDFICGEGCNWPSVTLDEYSYDSDTYPKGPERATASDTPSHCASLDDCINAIQIDWALGGEPDLVGALFDGGLTDEGEEYVIEAFQEGRDVGNRRLPDVWALYYGEMYPLIAEAWERELVYRSGGVVENDEDGDEGEGVRGNPFDVVPELEALRSKFCAAAQGVYDSWHQNDQGWSEDVADGGICHLIAEAIREVLGEHEIDSTTFSFSIGEVHVTAVADIDGDAYMVDIPARLYETGGGYTWRKIPDVIFEPRDVVIESMGEDFEDYLQEY